MTNRRSFFKQAAALLAATPILPSVLKAKEIEYTIPNYYTDKKVPNLKNIYLSPEALEDIRAWNVNCIDEIIRKEIYYNG